MDMDDNNVKLSFIFPLTILTICPIIPVFIALHVSTMNSMLGRTMLERKTVEALLDGKTEEIRVLLEEKGPELLIQRDGEGQTPLMLATENGDADMSRFLLKQGASPNDLNDFEQSSVHYACFEDQPEILQLLLENGGDVNIQDDIGRTPLFDAAEAEHHLQLYKLLLQHGARVDVIDEDGNTPLHRKLGHCSIVIVLNVKNQSKKYIHNSHTFPPFFSQSQVVLGVWKRRRCCLTKVLTSWRATSKDKRRSMWLWTFPRKRHFACTDRCKRRVTD
jgi:ankyrin repeat protein